MRLGGPGSVFEVVIERYENLVRRSEDMIVRQVSAEVENDLKQHLKRYVRYAYRIDIRRWDRTEGDVAPDSSLLQALTTFAGHLSTLSLLSDIPRSRLYRRIVNHLTNHISQRAIYAGWSKFTSYGGQDLSQEIADWISTSLTLDLPSGVEGIKAPWKGLEDAANVLKLKEEGESVEDVTFGQAMAVAWSDGEEAWGTWKERSGWNGDRETLKAVLRRRVDCWR